MGKSIPGPLYIGPCKLIWDYGITGGKLGLWDYTQFEIGITEIVFEIGITVFQSNRLRKPFQIGITGLHAF